jgi:gliding motility-associated lipoprotein GldH
MRTLCFFLACAFLLSSCESNSVFEGNQPVNPQEWKSFDPVHFEFETHDTITLHNFYLNVRNREDYAYSNLFFFVEMEFPNGKKSVDTVECLLANEQGQWLGEPTANIYSHEFLYQRAKQFPLGGRYKVDIRQGMRPDALKGITDVGFKLTHTSQ